MIRAFLLLLMLAGPAMAGLTQQQLDRVRVDLPQDAALDLAPGLPAVLIFADFDCIHLCDAVLAQTAGLLAETGLAPAEDYTLIVVGLDPRDDAAMAQDFVARQTPAPLRSAIRVMQPDRPALKRMTAALGYGFVFDAETGQFAHPAARFVLTKDGRVSAVLPAFDAAPEDLRGAILGARHGTGAIATRLILLCYGFDPVTGRYSLVIWRLLTVLSALTLLILGAWLGIAIWRERGTA
ncbi:hypothetical protein JHW45_01135 [Paracoccus stylophorae]|uniref:Protein SCO1/2 n=1 Tax=Paracoccus stylophorae TaxID=659350 RepID=A0ABY7SVX6_9RHOB|nr:hypothetical protein [Paracoccus stylophorae]WCR11049.1 hypothetical protein JHW45_01135 [Paracoccus stylophorae]